MRNQDWESLAFTIGQEAYGEPRGTRSKGNVEPAPSWRSLDLRGPNCERNGPEAYCFFALAFPGLLPPVWSFYGVGPERGL